MSPSRYIQAADGHRYHWAITPTFECPNADAIVYTAAPDGESDGTWSLRPPAAAAITAAADVLGADALLLARVLRSRHQAQGVERLRVDGKLTDRCSVCGARMDRKGYRAWISAPSTDESQKRVAARLAMTAPRETVRTTWHDTLKGAHGWAGHERDRDDAADSFGEPVELPAGYAGHAPGERCEASCRESYFAACKASDRETFRVDPRDGPGRSESGRRPGRDHRRPAPRLGADQARGDADRRSRPVQPAGRPAGRHGWRCC